jgi:tetratricopeptide (TPR) repeat protein/tRNA A-37 threonylcarbamoyl transferase component Bud32
MPSDPKPSFDDALLSTMAQESDPDSGEIAAAWAARVAMEEASTLADHDGAPRPASAEVTIIDRYRVLRELGRGGMGVTYLAYDEALDRRVAIKLVHPGIQGGIRAQLRLRREAQALARLAHPNIVHVYEVGTYQERVFIVMEFVRGQTLDAWLAAGERTWPQILDVFRQAGKGLRAAHEAGLVHRDFKPANVLVGDDDRVRVVDFGLARLAEQLDTPDTIDTDTGSMEEDASGSSDLDLSLTRTGARLGTPAYMAPEQLAGRTVDVRSDQFSFCVSLFEALYADRPFAGNNAAALQDSIERGLPRRVAQDSPVPAWVEQVVTRGLAADPAARWPSMEALLDALARDPAQVRRRLLLGGALGLSLLSLGAAIVAVIAVEQGARAERCSSAADELDETWNPARRQAVQQAILATGVPFAADTWERTAAALDRYADEWTEASTDACEDTIVRVEQSEDVRYLRVLCLAERRRSMHALAQALTDVDAESITEAAGAVNTLPRIASCTDMNYLRARVRPPRNADVAAQVDALRSQLALAAEKEEIGQYEAGLALAQDVARAAIRLDYPPLMAEVWLRVGSLQAELGAHAEAEAILRDAFFEARRSDHREVAGEAAARLVFVLGERMSRFEDARTWGLHAEIEIEAAGSPELRALLLNNLGQSFLRQQRHAEAAEHLKKAVDIATRALGPEHPDVGRWINNLGLVAKEQGHYEQAEAHHRKALAIIEQALGPEHPHVAIMTYNLGQALQARGDHEQAALQYRNALVHMERSLDSGHLLMAWPLLSLASLHLDSGQPAKALPLAEHALRVLEPHPVDAASDLAEARFVVARVLAAIGQAGDMPRAIALAHQARDVYRDIWRATPSPAHERALAEITVWLSEVDASPGRAPSAPSTPGQ